MPCPSKGCRAKVNLQAVRRPNEQVAEAHAFSQLHERLLVLRVGPRLAFFPEPHRVRIGSEASGNLRPRQAGLLLEPLQPLRKVGGEVVGFSMVEYALSRDHTSLPVHNQLFNPIRTQASSSRGLNRIQPSARLVGLAHASIHLCTRSYFSDRSGDCQLHTLRQLPVAPRGYGSLHIAVLGGR